MCFVSSILRAQRSWETQASQHHKQHLAHVKEEALSIPGKPEEDVGQMFPELWTLQEATEAMQAPSASALTISLRKR